MSNFTGWSRATRTSVRPSMTRRSTARIWTKLASLELSGSFASGFALAGLGSRRAAFDAAATGGGGFGSPTVTSSPLAVRAMEYFGIKSPLPSMTMREPSSRRAMRTPLTRAAPSALPKRPATPCRSMARRAGSFNSTRSNRAISPSAPTCTTAAPSFSLTSTRPSLPAGFFTSAESSRESTRCGSAAGAAAGFCSPSVSTTSLPSAATSYFASASSATTMRPTCTLSSSNWAPLQPAMPASWLSTCLAAAVTSPPFRSITTRGGPESLKAVNSGFPLAWMKSRAPLCSTDVTFTAAAAKAAGEAAIETAAARNTTCLLCILFSFEVVPRTLTLPPRDTEVFPFLQRVEIALFFLGDGHGQLHVLRVHASRRMIGDGLGDHDLVAADPRHLSAVLADEVAQPQRPAAVIGILHHRQRRGGAGHRHRELERVQRPLLQRRLGAAPNLDATDPHRGHRRVLERIALADGRVDVDVGQRHGANLVVGDRLGGGGTGRSSAPRRGRRAAAGGGEGSRGGGAREGGGQFGAPLGAG